LFDGRHGEERVSRSLGVDANTGINESHATRFTRGLRRGHAPQRGGPPERRRGGAI